MKFRKISLQDWKRREQFEHYCSTVPCTYSMTVKLDITNAVNARQKLYPTMLHALSRTVNSHEEFRTAIDADGALGVFDVMYPCYTVFHKETETFSNIWTRFDEDYNQFLAAYLDDIAKYGDVAKMNAKPNAPANTFPVSMIPWESFDGFNLNLQKGYDYLIPIFTLGKYYQENGCTYIPLAIQVHHAVCDGFHVCRFISELREYFQG
ncbi:MAG: type A chloramphenicol O-acetyltransferase [Clostridiales bacterium]|nr:type A chloramphenicol O-acetyltransferase [Clostridiales bacterium]